MIDNSFIYNTDFIKAINKNKRNCTYLVIFLILIMAILGYLLGLFIELQSQQPLDYYHQDFSQDFSQGFSSDYSKIFYLSNFGLTFAFFAICISIIWTSVAVFFGHKIILFSANATEVTSNDQKNDKNYLVLSNVVQEISIAAGISPPKIYIIETEALNAFATGFSPEKSAVAVTRGLLEKLNRDELQGVVAHEIGHVINYDIRYQTLVSSLVGMIILLSDIARRMVFYSNYSSNNSRSSSRSSNNSNNNNANLVLIVGLSLFIFSIIAPIAALILQMTVSREREYLADATSVKLTRDPAGLISALTKLESENNLVNDKPFDGASRANQNLFIVNPFKRVAKIKNNLFSTHPQIQLRIERLRDLGR